ncbi:MFS transporter [Corynebacterium heidelbergense]|uniref:MFS transporter n=1 Tax=Corynebacterium heidelbergense TaxID=2055947 RepID=A0A364VD75_9CORY|nr:MFS transporter [Corynebacterium heidelbergense]RAV34580.1 MFS transporter [Corynebacterium heidelbergense]
MSVGLIFVAVIVAAINLRAAIASLGPVLPDVLAHFGAGGSLAGVITALPGAMFAVMGLSTVPLARRIGLSRTLLLGAVITLIGTAARPWLPGVWVFIVLTGLVAAGIAIGNVLVPAFVKKYGGRHTVTLMTVYSALLGFSGAVGPLSALLFHGENRWQWTLFIWALFCGVQVAIWTVVALRTGMDAPKAADRQAQIASTGPAATTSMWRSRTAIFLMLFFGIQSMNAYTQMGWLPQIFQENGVSPMVASIALAVVGSFHVLGGTVMPTVIDRAENFAIYPVIFGVLTAAGWAGILLAPTQVPLLWAVLLGMGGWCFPTAIALIPARTRVSLITARLSGFVQPYGYIIAAAGPLVIGMIHGITHSWTAILLGLMALALVMGAIGVRASRKTVIDDELAGAAGAKAQR